MWLWEISEINYGPGALGPIFWEEHAFPVRRSWLMVGLATATVPIPE